MTPLLRPPQFPVSANNPVGLEGIEWVELVSPQPELLAELMRDLGFARTMRHASRAIDLYQQNEITFLVNHEPSSFAERFGRLHGPSICSMAFRVRAGKQALRTAVARGAAMAPAGDYHRAEAPLPAVLGLGDSLIYLVDGGDRPDKWARLGFEPAPGSAVEPKGLIAIDHLTNNVQPGTLSRWAEFYRSVFGFEEVRSFEIRSAHPGLTSYALRSPCGRFCIPINEAGEEQSQLNDYLAEYRGPGIHHLAFRTDDLIGSLRQLENTPIAMLDIDDEYDFDVFQRLPVSEDKHELFARNVLIDGDETGYLLQIFTQKLIGPIFIELIQRKRYQSFGEGKFSALFRSLKRDQQRRGCSRAPDRTSRSGRSLGPRSHNRGT